MKETVQRNTQRVRALRCEIQSLSLSILFLYFYKRPRSWYIGHNMMNKEIR